jgi:hypothetical protein
MVSEYAECQSAGRAPSTRARKPRGRVKAAEEQQDARHARACARARARHPHIRCTCDDRQRPLPTAPRLGRQHARWIEQHHFRAQTKSHAEKPFCCEVRG